MTGVQTCALPISYLREYLFLGSTIDRKAVKTVNVEGVLDPSNTHVSAVWEVHLRGNPDPKYRYLVPLFRAPQGDFKLGPWDYIEAYDDCDGLLDPPRYGFLAREPIE